MVNREISLILQEIASELKLKGDVISLKSLSRIASYKYSFDKLTPKDIVPTEETEPFPVDDGPKAGESAFRDMRLSRMVFKYFRTFHDAGSKPLGINFARGEHPCSTFLVGRNGTGKSTIFDAIEYYYTGMVSNADQKYIWETPIYLTFGFGRIPGITPDKVLLEVRTKAGTQKIGVVDEREPLCQPASFCSEKDISDLSYMIEDDLYDYIFAQLGYTELLELQQKIKDFLVTQGETDDGAYLKGKDVEAVIEAFVEYRDGEQKEIALSECRRYGEANYEEIFGGSAESRQPGDNGNLERKLFLGHWERLDSERKEGGNAQLMFQKLQQMYTLLKEALEATNVVGAFHLFMNQMDMLKQKEEEQVATPERRMDQMKAYNIAVQMEDPLDNAIDNIVKGFVSQYGSFIEDCLSYFSEENETFKLVYNKGEGTVKMTIQVQKDEGHFLTDPYEYLNSFRFKLYAIALKLSLAFWYMKKNNCVLPVAIDDVFNANDFDNSGRLQQFVHRIYQLFYDKVCKTIPLQVILLTHDEMILSAFRKGFNVREVSRWNESAEQRKQLHAAYQLYSDNCIVGRLFHYWDARRMYNKVHKGYLYDDILNLYNKLN